MQYQIIYVYFCVLDHAFLYFMFWIFQPLHCYSVYVFLSFGLVHGVLALNVRSGLIPLIVSKEISIIVKYI